MWTREIQYWEPRSSVGPVPNWSDSPAELTGAHGTFDVILGADLVYSSGCVAGLARAVVALLRPGGTLLLCSPSGRHGLRQFTAALEAAGLRCTEQVLDAELLRDAEVG